MKTGLEAWEVHRLIRLCMAEAEDLNRTAGQTTDPLRVELHQEVKRIRGIQRKLEALMKGR